MELPIVSHSEFREKSAESQPKFPAMMNPNHESGFARPRSVAFALAAAGMFCASVSGQNSPPPSPAAANTEKIELIRAELSRALEIEQTIAREETDWKLGKEVLANRVAFLENQIKELDEKAKDEQGKITVADEERGKKLKEAEGLTAADEEAKARVRAIEARVLKLLPALPAPLAEKIGPLAERLPKPEMKDEEIRLSVSVRYANVLGILNEVNKFHGDVFTGPERRKISTGAEAEVETLYFGIAAACYAGSGETAKEAGIGKSSPQGWEWEAKPADAANIAKVIKIQGGATPEFVPMMIQTDAKGGEQP
jgi:hypothetical protein